MNKTFLATFLYWFLMAGAVTLVCGNFIIAGHITLPNIGLAVMGGCSIMLCIIFSRLVFGFDWTVWLSFAGLFFVFVLACIINNESRETTSMVLTLRTILVGYSAAVFILPAMDRRFYYVVFSVFIVTNIILAGITLYNYYDLIIIHHGEGLHPSWVNFIDMMYSRIIPYSMYHHTLSVLSVFSVFLCYEIIKEKYYLISTREHVVFYLFIIFLVSFLHFLSARIGLIVLYSGFFIALFSLMKRSLVSGSILLLYVFIMLVIVSLIISQLPTIQIKLALSAEELIFYLRSSYDQILHGPDYRLKFYFESFEIIKAHPFTGIGFENMQSVLKTGHHPHNAYLYYAVVFGIPLSVLLFIFTYLPLFFWKGKLPLPIIFIYLIHTIYSFTDANINIREYLYFMSFWIPMMFHYSNARLQFRSN